MATTDIIHRFAEELKLEIEALAEGEPGELISADDSMLEAVTSVYMTLDALLEVIPQVETLGDSCTALGAPEPFNDEHPLLIHGSIEEDPDNPGSALPAPDATEEEKVAAYHTVPMESVLKLVQVMDVPASLATQQEKDYVRYHRLVKGGFDGANIDSLLEHIQKTSEEDALNRMSEGVEWDIPEDLMPPGEGTN